LWILKITSWVDSFVVITHMKIWLGKQNQRQLVTWNNARNQLCWQLERTPPTPPLCTRGRHMTCVFITDTRIFYLFCYPRDHAPWTHCHTDLHAWQAFQTSGMVVNVTELFQMTKKRTVDHMLNVGGNQRG
jgi:hypothetical protein